MFQSPLVFPLLFSTIFIYLRKQRRIQKPRTSNAFFFLGYFFLFLSCSTPLFFFVAFFFWMHSVCISEVFLHDLNFIFFFLLLSVSYCYQNTTVSHLLGRRDTPNSNKKKCRKKKKGRMYVLHPLVLTVCVINSKYMNVFFSFCGCNFENVCLKYFFASLVLLK